jgi:bifunctional oligoribonuclease and PAP phosphatase NrnA
LHIDLLNLIICLNKLDFSTVSELLKTPKKIFLTSHSNPDGDALGSLLAMYHFLCKTGHEVSMMVPNRFPEFLRWMPGQENILLYENDSARCDTLFEKSDILFSLDYNSPDRIEKAADAFRNSRALKILIDHHIQPDIKAYDHILTTTQVSSTSELVYLLMRAINPELLDKTIAECICVGIMTDTGSFSYNCNFESTFGIIAELIGKGINVDEINRKVYATNSENKLKLLGFALSQKLRVFPQYRTAYIALSQSELQEYQHKTGDTEGLVNYALSIDGVVFAALFTERTNKIRVSFRSVGDFSVNDFARNHFSGGGHRNAAGGDSFEDMESTLEKFENLLKDYSVKLNSID